MKPLFVREQNWQPDNGFRCQALSITRFPSSPRSNGLAISAMLALMLLRYLMLGRIAVYLGRGPGLALSLSQVLSR